MKPNLFANATKELSQDGFFTWLMQWASPDCSAHNHDLCRCAQDFLKFLISKQPDTVDMPTDFAITSVQVERQRHSIDMWVEINKNILIIIEDKTNTSHHGNQLERYKDFAQKWCSQNNRHLVCIYLKTGDELESSLKIVRTQGYAVVNRCNLLCFFEQYKVKNDIYIDFVAHIRAIEDRQQSYATSPVGSWTKDSWKGFFGFVEKHLEDCYWTSYHNTGPLYLQWSAVWRNEYFICLQINQDTGNLVFMMGSKSGKIPRQVLQQWNTALMNLAAQEGKSEIQSPQNIDKELKHKALAIVPSAVWLGAPDSVIGKDAVVARLKEYEAFFDRFVKQGTV
jgi:hypothetical protein